MKPRRFDRPLNTLDELRRSRAYSTRHVAKLVSELVRDRGISQATISAAESHGTDSLYMLIAFQVIYSRPPEGLSHPSDDPARWIVPLDEIIRLNYNALSSMPEKYIGPTRGRRLRDIFNAEFGDIIRRTVGTSIRTMYSAGGTNQLYGHPFVDLSNMIVAPDGAVGIY